ncbi:hypothetical protein [Pacificispira sp.]|uniref:hypothetical protein n=1 Tax=Pacificispira sp. TaxID=2888761 RepID=UPI003B51649F
MAEYKIFKLATGHLPVDGFFKHQRGQVLFWPTAKGPAVILTVPEASRSAEAFQALQEGVFSWSLRCAAVLTLLYAVSVAIVFYSQPDLTEPEAEYSSGITVLASMAPCVSSVFLIGHLIGATRSRRLKLREANRLHSAGAELLHLERPTPLLLRPSETQRIMPPGFNRPAKMVLGIVFWIMGIFWTFPFHATPDLVPAILLLAAAIPQCVMGMMLFVPETRPVATRKRLAMTADGPVMQDFRHLIRWFRYVTYRRSGLLVVLVALPFFNVLVNIPAILSNAFG